MLAPDWLAGVGDHLLQGSADLVVAVTPELVGSVVGVLCVPQEELRQVEQADRVAVDPGNAESGQNVGAAVECEVNGCFS